jgi:hypothetical protein
MKRLILISLLSIFFGQIRPSDSQSVPATVTVSAPVNTGTVASTGAASSKVGDGLLAEQVADLQQMRQFATAGIQDVTSAASDIKKAMKNLADQAKNDQERLLEDGVLDGYLDSLNKIVSDGQDALSAKVTKYQGLIDTVLNMGSKKLTDLAGSNPDSIAAAGDYKTTLTKQHGDSRGQVVDARDKSLDEISSLQTTLTAEIRDSHQKESDDEKDKLEEILIGTFGAAGTATSVLVKYLYDKYAPDLAEAAKYYAKQVVGEKIPSLQVQPTAQEAAAIKKLGLPEEYRDLGQTSGGKALKVVINKLSMVGKNIQENIKSKFNLTDDQVAAIMGQQQDPEDALVAFETARSLVVSLVEQAGQNPLNDAELGAKILQKIQDPAGFAKWQAEISQPKGPEGSGAPVVQQEPKVQEQSKASEVQTAPGQAGVPDSRGPVAGASENVGLSTGGIGSGQVASSASPIRLPTEGLRLPKVLDINSSKPTSSQAQIEAESTQLGSTVAAVDQSVNSGITESSAVPVTSPQSEIDWDKVNWDDAY